MKRIIAFLTLFSSTSTLFCCAIPALFVAVGSGAVFASLISQFPSLVFLSEHKILLFLISGIMISMSFYLQVRSSRAECPIDPILAANCKGTKNWSKPVLIISTLVYATGLFFAFIAPVLF